MIVIRNVFQLKFGHAKETKTLMMELHTLMKKFGLPPARFLTDVTGNFYTFVMEFSYDNLAAFEKSSLEFMGTKEFSQWYQKLIPLVESGKREIFTVVQ